MALLSTAVRPDASPPPRPHLGLPCLRAPPRHQHGDVHGGQSKHKVELQCGAVSRRASGREQGGAAACRWPRRPPAARVALQRMSPHRPGCESRPAKHRPANPAPPHLRVVVRHLLLLRQHRAAAAAASAAAVHSRAAGGHAVEARRRALLLLRPRVRGNQRLLPPARAAQGGRRGRQAPRGDAKQSGRGCSLAARPGPSRPSTPLLPTTTLEPTTPAHLNVCVLDPARKAE